MPKSIQVHYMLTCNKTDKLNEKFLQVKNIKFQMKKMYTMHSINLLLEHSLHFCHHLNFEKIP